MKVCSYCDHGRMLHTSWGCSNTGCHCGVSIIYLTPISTVESDKAADEEMIKQANLLAAEADRLGESVVRALLERSIVEQNPPGEGSAVAANWS